ncbi:MAG: phytanoyl-CoA dioxygenase family protein [Gemmataceae bacterium]|nr:phytanoyl-CoA dioxygenase family protein [Gemmataceae bacterium]
MSTATLDHPAAAADIAAADIVRELEEHGAVRLPRLVSEATLADMQAAFRSRLERLRRNNCDGYERTERLRLMVQDVLTLAQGFVDVALHPLVKGALNGYLGPAWELCEAKGWRSLPTRRDFHGWHGDMWYDQTKITERVPREVKLAFYLSDVRSGAFQYIRGSHGQVPHHLPRHEVEHLPLDRMVEFLGPAGTAVLFDTSGSHRQGIPILELREAIFYNYHDPAIPLQQEDVEYYRYHPLLLNAAFLGGLTAADMRILGFGNKTHYQPNHVRRAGHRGFQRLMGAAYGVKLCLGEWTGRVTGKVQRVLGLTAR